MEKNFGKLVYQSRPSKSTSIKKRLKWHGLAALGIIGFGLFAVFVLPKETAVDFLLAYGAIALGVLVVILIFVLPTTSNEVAIYENGLKLKTKAYERNVHYSELIGVCDASVVRHDNPENARDFKIDLRGEHIIASFLLNFFHGLHDYGIVVDTITNTYTDFLVKDLTKSNIHQAEIRFSVSIAAYEFDLKNGKFILNTKKRTQEIAVEDIKEVKILLKSVQLMHMSDGKLKKWAGFLHEDMINIRALYHIVHKTLQEY
jgi:hypothetical protein